MSTSPTKAAPLVLAFDVFGTVVDWHGTVTKEMSRVAPDIDGAEFARAWRAGYAPAMKRTMASGEWKVLDELHMGILKEICPQFGLNLDEEQLENLNKVWHRLQPWPDSADALRRLKTKYIITPLSNGGVALLTNMAKRGDLNWDLILSAEIFHAYKPDPRTYQGVARILDVPLDRVMMVATHHSDLDAAQDAGLQTAYIERPDENGVGFPKDSERKARHPLHFRDLAEFAGYMGC